MIGLIVSAPFQFQFKALAVNTLDENGPSNKNTLPVTAKEN